MRGGIGGRGEEGSRCPAFAKVEEEWAPAGVAAACARKAQASLYSVLFSGYPSRGGCASRAGEGWKTGFISHAQAWTASRGSGCAQPRGVGDGEGVLRPRTRKAERVASARAGCGGRAGQPGARPSWVGADSGVAPGFSDAAGSPSSGR